MSRKHRIWYPGAMYHITSRGNRRSALFYDEMDRKAYLELLEEVRFYHPFHLHAYCLMTNHIHLQLETTTHHIKHIMKMLNSRYALHFNKRHHLVGHVFQGRYGAELIETKDYQLEVSRYIHLNPVEAEMVSLPEDYRWSSYRAYVIGEGNPHVRTKKILAYFSAPERENYQMFVEEGMAISKISMIYE
ncbi:transposase [Oceanobacillus longus]|uniref:Transposase n=1 Tax=Oceanobacillus longus TaxID=930120 RepID=A0ABV8H1S2_9BACI